MAKKWKGDKSSGSAPARHIPWPELFKHHISVIEGHTRMLEMVQQHTAPGTENHGAISDMVGRSLEILRQSKASSQAFVPPADQFDSVPLGSATASVYPGYSPANVEKRGEVRKAEDDAAGADFEVALVNGSKRQKLSAPEEEIEAAQESGVKREAEEEEGSSRKKKKKKTGEEIVIETEDISAEVDAKLKAKKEKKERKEKKDKKRSAEDDGERKKKKTKE